MQECYEVVPSTICQYTGFRDVEGVKAFENDIVFYEKPRKTGKIVFAGGQFLIEWKDDDCLNKNVEFWFTKRRIHVIGNVFDEEEDER